MISNSPKFLVFLFFFGFSVHGQHALLVDNAYISQAEKIYLQLDKNVYSTGQTLWFKAIVTQGVDQKPTNYSGVLYVELIDDKGIIVNDKTVKLEKGVGEQFFYLNEGYIQGRYLVRAYTKWNLNFGSEFYFKQYISIFDSNIDQEPIRLTMDNTKEPEHRMNIDLFPDALDKTHQGTVQVVLDLDGDSKTFTVDKQNDAYRFKYNIPSNTKMVSLNMETNNGKSFSKTIVPNQQDIDIQFLPEGGKMLHGLPSKVGFKAINNLGKGTPIQGCIEDNLGNTIVNFKSNALGMGYFLILPDSTKTYKAYLKIDNTKKLYSFPKVYSKGQVLTLNRIKDSIRLVTSSINAVNDSIVLALKQRGKTQFLVKAFMRGKHFSIKIPTNTLPSGVHAACLYNSNDTPISERLFFNHNSNIDLPLKLSTDKQAYVRRETTSLSIEAPVSNLSVLVINKSELGALQDKRQNILSYFLLDSELKGEIENPGYYFNTGENNHYNIESLMLTQGWRNYSYGLQPDGITYRNEPTLELSGKIENLLGGKSRKALVTMITVEDNPKTFVQPVDSLGRFHFKLNNRYGSPLEAILQTANKTGKTKNYTLNIDKKIVPEIQYNILKKAVPVDSTVQKLIIGDKQRKEALKPFEIDPTTVALNAVHLEGENLTQEQTEVRDLYGDPDSVLYGDDIREKEEKWSFGLYGVLRQHYPEVSVSRVTNIFGKNFNYAHILGTSGPTLISIDGQPLNINDYKILDALPTNDIKSIDVIKNIKDNNHLLRRAFPTYLPNHDRVFLINNSIINNNFIDTSPFKDNRQLDPFGLFAKPAKVKHIIGALGSRIPIWMKLPYVQSSKIPSLSVLNFTEVSLISVYTKSGTWLSGISQPKGVNQISIPVYSPKMEFYKPKYKSLEIYVDTEPDERVVVHWQPQIVLNEEGVAQINYHNSDNLGEVDIIVEGITPDGKIGYKTLTYEVVEDLN